MRALALLAGLGVVALALFLWLGSGTERAERTLPAGERRPADPAEASELRPATAPGIPSVAGAAATSAQRAEQTEAPAAGASVWLVRVLRKGAPVAGAELAWATSDEQRAFRAEPDPLERVKRGGHRVRTDANGEAHMPPPSARLRVAAWDGAWVAQRWLEPDAVAPIELELELDRTLRVRVVDERGAPVASVPVGLRLMTGRTEHVASVPTGADGLAVFRHLGLGWGLDDERTTGTARLDGVFAAPIETPFSLRAWPAEPLELVLPPDGAVVIEVVDELGQPIASAERGVGLAIERAQIAGAEVWDRAGRVEHPLEDGRARFELVGLGLELSAELDDRPRHQPVETTLAGPQRAGEEVVARLVLGEAETELLLRVLDPAGEPLRDAELTAARTRAMGGGTLGDSDALRTDGEGRARMPLVEPWSEGTKLTLDLAYTDALGAHAAAELDLSRSFPPGATDLGDVRLAWLAPLVAGRVLDAKGEPVTSGQLRVEMGHERGAGQELAWSTRFWGSVGVDGSFAVYEDAPEGPLRLALDNDQYVPPAPVPFTPGTRDLVITLERGGALAGAARLPDGIGAESFQVVVRLAGGTERKAQLGEDGSFTLAGLPPGPVGVAFELVPGGIELVAFADVVVVDGETSRDPRLARVDLAQAVRRITVRVRAPGGSPAEGGWVRATDTIADHWKAAAFVLENGAAELLLRAVPAELEVNVPGYRIVRLAGVESDQNVTLEPAFALRCELPAEVELPSGASLMLALTPERGGSAYGLSLFRGSERVGWWNSAFGDESNTFDERRELLLPIQEPGVYLADFHVVYGQPGGGRMSFEIPASAETRRIEVDERSAGKTLRVAPDAAQYAERLGAGR